MHCSRRDMPVALYFIVFHAAAAAAAVYFDLDLWIWGRSPTSISAISAVGAGLLIFAGADLGMLSLWAALSTRRAVMRAPATAACLVGWCIVYNPRLPRLLRDWSYLSDQTLFFELPALFGLPLLTMTTVCCALGLVHRRGGRFRQLTPHERGREATRRQFQVSHLLVLTAVLALVLAFSINGHEFLSRRISMRWSRFAYAPIYSAETVLFSAFCLATTALAASWAMLGYGRPWLQLAMALTTGCLMGFCWAYAFTSPHHQEHLVWNGSFSAGVGFLQAAAMSAALLIARRRGYRFCDPATALKESDANRAVSTFQPPSLTTACRKNGP